MTDNPVWTDAEYSAVLGMAESLRDQLAAAERRAAHYKEHVDEKKVEHVLHAVRTLVEKAYREGFTAGAEHNNISYKYPPVDIAWTYSEAREELTGEKQTEPMPEWDA